MARGLGLQGAPVRVAALVDDATARRLSRALPAKYRLTAAPRARELPTLLASSRSDLILIDPTADDARTEGEHISRVVREALTAASPAPVLLYVRMEPGSIKSILEYAVVGAVGLLIRGVDDHPAALRVAFETALGGRLQAHVLEVLADRLETLPSGLRDAVRELLWSPEEFRDVEDLARRSGMGRRSVDRWLARADLASARVFLCAAHVGVAYRLLRSPDAQVATVARKLCYASGRALSNDVASVLGCSAAALAGNADADAVAWLVGERLGRRGDTARHSATQRDTVNDLCSHGEMSRSHRALHLAAGPIPNVDRHT
ncbi:MAG: hypothetical protein Q8K82_07030 [Gemmatimonadaceae bacterium]|nr:hypothetical protein [Gemmatimonadaceae bacterium]